MNMQISSAGNEPVVSETLNGLSLDGVAKVLGALQADGSLGRFQFRARNRWVDGGTNRSSIQGFYGVGREDDSRATPFEFVNGEPPALLGDNAGANPVEFLLHALAGCVTTTMIVHATARGITIRSLSTELEGDLDIRGLLGFDEAIPAGYESIAIRMKVEADCSDEELEDLITYAKAHSPVCNTINRPVPVTVTRQAA